MYGRIVNLNKKEVANIINCKEQDSNFYICDFIYDNIENKVHFYGNEIYTDGKDEIFKELFGENYINPQQFLNIKFNNLVIYKIENPIISKNTSSHSGFLKNINSDKISEIIGFSSYPTKYSKQSWYFEYKSDKVSGNASIDYYANKFRTIGEPDLFIYLFGKDHWVDNKIY